MPRSPLFSTYRQGENRVTSSMLAVLERIDMAMVEQLLARVSGESALSLVTFANQSWQGDAVPDAVIEASCRFFFEVKTQRGAVDGEQLRRHLQHLDGQHGQERLFVVSPDPHQPSVVSGLEDQRVIWFNFEALSSAIDTLLDNAAELVPDQSRFLLRELQALFAQDGLINQADTVVVAASIGWPEYEKYHAYICQPGRSFQDGVQYLGFYAAGAVQPCVAQILSRTDPVELTVEHAEMLSHSEDTLERQLAEVIKQVLADGARKEGQFNKIFLLSGPDDERTVRLTGPIRNVALDQRGRPTAWTQNQRYTRLGALRTATDTSTLAL
jgi:hypothetical protein